MEDVARCAIEIQDGSHRAQRRAFLLWTDGIEFRVGTHVGDVVEESDGDLMGDGVNIAARLEGIANPIPICLSEDAYRQVSGRLEIEATDLGPTQLKNIDRQICAYSLQVGVPGKAEAEETGRTRDAHTAEEAALARAARRARGAHGCRRGRRVVVPQCEPAGKRRHDGARRGCASFHRRHAALRSTCRAIRGRITSSTP